MTMSEDAEAAENLLTLQYTSVLQQTHPRRTESVCEVVGG